MATILIVDDSRTSRKILRNVLEGAGHEVVGEAKNGQEGIDMFESLEPDLVTMDITMPILDGETAMKQIIEKHPGAKVVMITASGQKEKVIECLKNGASEFISKPYEPDAVLEVIERVIG